jgi:hypothetical protein
MSLLLPVDDNGNPMQVLGFAKAGTQKLTVASSSVRTATALADHIQVITLIATGPCRFAIGSSEVAADPATSPFLYPGIYVDVPLRKGERHVAFVTEAEDCIAYVIGRN